jgi:pyridoxal 5'-phosphate synthase pdxS subunit
MMLGSAAGRITRRRIDVRGTPIVEAATNFRDPHILAKVSRGLGKAMKGQEIDKLDVKLAERGW